MITVIKARIPIYIFRRYFITSCLSFDNVSETFLKHLTSMLFLHVLRDYTSSLSV